METTETRANTGVSPENHAPSSSQNRAPRRGISDAALRAAKPNDNPYKIAVGDGLYLEVKPSGSKLWRWKYRLLGKENRCSFGKYPNLTLKEARDAMEAARKLVKKGIHPAQQKQLDRLKASLEQANTFEAIAREWVALRDWEEITKKRRINMLERVVFPHIGKLPAKQVVPVHILDILKRADKNNGNSVSQEAKRTMSAIFQFAVATLCGGHVFSDSRLS